MSTTDRSDGSALRTFGEIGDWGEGLHLRVWRGTGPHAQPVEILFDAAFDDLGGKGLTYFQITYEAVPGSEIPSEFGTVWELVRLV